MASDLGLHCLFMSHGYDDRLVWVVIYLFLLQQRDKSLKIAENLQQVEEWKERSNNLLYSMIPQSIADRLKNGEDPINTCEVICQFNNF